MSTTCQSCGEKNWRLTFVPEADRFMCPECAEEYEAIKTPKKRILGISPAQAKRLAAQQGATLDDWPEFLDPNCPYAKRMKEQEEKEKNNCEPLSKPKPQNTR